MADIPALTVRSLPILALLASLALCPEATAFDHFDPAALGTTANASMQNGDLDTARVLLERAIRLAPHNERLLQLKTELEDLGSPSASRAARPDRPPEPVTIVPPPPPAIWPVK